MAPSFAEAPTSAARPRGSAAFLTPEGAFLGAGSNSDPEAAASVPLLEKDADGRFRPRNRGVLEKLLTRGYGAPMRLAVRQLEAVASALNRGDLKTAHLSLSRLGLPPLPSVSRARMMAQADGIAPLAKVTPGAGGALRRLPDRLPKGVHGGGQFTFASGGSGAPAEKLAALEADLKDPNVQAFLSTIAQAEVATYNTTYGGGTFDDFSKFPGYGKANTVSGRYQIRAATYDELSRKLGLTDFSPHTQDLMAAQLLNEKGAMKFIRAGNLDAALAGASKIWASLPESPNKPGRYKKQPYMPYDTVRSTFERNRIP